MISYKTKLLLTALAFLAFMELSCSKKPVVEPAIEPTVEPVATGELQTDDKMHIDGDVWSAFYDTFRGKYDGEHRLRDDLNEQAFDALMKSGADINVRNEDGQTLLMATQEVSVIEALIAAGIDVNARDREGRTALMYAASDGGQYCDDEEELEHIACKAGTGPCDNEEDYHCEDVYAEDVLIAAGADVNAKDVHGKTVIMHIRDLEGEAIYSGYSHSAHFLRTLVAAGANVNASPNEDTPLMYAVYPSHVKILVDAGADVNASNASGLTPLMFAELVDTQETLIAAGADVNARDKHGIPAFWYAYLRQFRFHYPDDEAPGRAIELFKKAGADIHAKSPNNQTLSEYILQACDRRQKALEACKDEDGFNCELNKWKNLDTTIEQLAWNVCSEEDCDLSDVLELLKP
ncbi:MAG: ankyrin repeat domain-containing protein [Proteobacteria bacterium]|nr:ankyrin repeat domain-containing protein [Pseudomonadota bacterium]